MKKICQVSISLSANRDHSTLHSATRSVQITSDSGRPSALTPNCHLCHVSVYDGGDCCECTCVNTDDNICGENGGFACVDPSAACFDDRDTTPPSETEDGSTSGESAISCVEDYVSDGDCDPRNNREECGASRLMSSIGNPVRNIALSRLRYSRFTVP